MRYIIGGPQGGGLETTSEILSWAFAWSGYGIISDREYFSNIKGRHSYVHATVSATELPKHLTYPVDIVAAMDAETVFTHFNDLRMVDTSSITVMMIPLITQVYRVWRGS